MTTAGQLGSWLGIQLDSPRSTPTAAADGADWLMISVAVATLVILVVGIGIYLYPNSESGRFDRCVGQRAEIFLNKMHFPVIAAIGECTTLRDQGGLGNPS